VPSDVIWFEGKGKIVKGMLPIPEKPGMVIVHIECARCNDMAKVEAPVEGVFLFLAGLPINQCFPSMSTEDREMFVTGFCSKCSTNQHCEKVDNDICLN